MTAANVISGKYEVVDQKEVTYVMLFKNIRVLMAMISSIIAMIFMLFFLTILSDHLIAIDFS